jgi:hypothetical protein
MPTKIKANPIQKPFYGFGPQVNYRMTTGLLRQITNTRKGKPAPHVDEPIRAAIARQAATPLPKNTLTIFAAYRKGDFGDEYERLHELATAQGWGDNYTIRTETNGLRAYKTLRK